MRENSSTEMNFQIFVILSCWLLVLTVSGKVFYSSLFRAFTRKLPIAVNVTEIRGKKRIFKKFSQSVRIQTKMNFAQLLFIAGNGQHVLLLNVSSGQKFLLVLLFI